MDDTQKAIQKYVKFCLEAGNRAYQPNIFLNYVVFHEMVRNAVTYSSKCPTGARDIFECPEIMVIRHTMEEFKELWVNGITSTPNRIEVTQEGLNKIAARYNQYINREHVWCVVLYSANGPEKSTKQIWVTYTYGDGFIWNTKQKNLATLTMLPGRYLRQVNPPGFGERVNASHIMDNMASTNAPHQALKEIYQQLYEQNT